MSELETLEYFQSLREEEKKEIFQMARKLDVDSRGLSGSKIDCIYANHIKAINEYAKTKRGYNETS